MKKKLIICFFAFALIFPLVGKAIAPVIALGAGIDLLLGAASSGVVGAEVATLATATSASVSAMWTGVVTALGAAVIYASIKDSAGNAVRLPVHSAHTSPPQPTGAPSTTASVGVYHVSGFTSTQWDSSSASQTCTNWALQYLCTGSPCASGQTPNFTSSLSGTTCNVLDAGGNVYISATISLTSSSCPSGYSISGSDCVLVNARAVVADLNCDVTRSGATFSYSSGDLDCAVAGKIKGVISGDTWTVGGVDQFGNPVQISVKAESNGETTVLSIVNTKNADANDLLTEKSVRFSSSGEPVFNSQTQRPGSLQPSTSSQSLTLVNAPSNAIYNTSGASQSITFPNDYSREATSQAANTKLDTLHTDLTQASVAPIDPVARTDSEIASVFFPSTFTALNAWQLPVHSSVCPTMNFDAFSHNFTIDAHCALITNNVAVVSTIMLLVWASMAMFIVLKA